MFGFSKSRKQIHPAAKMLYLLAMEQSRTPVLYTDYGVPDTMDGRFDCLLLHIYIIFHRIKGLDEYKRLSQDMFDYCFADMDQSLREAGIGDMGVPKRMKKMMLAFNGRMHVYDEAVRGSDDSALGQAILRNVYNGADDMAGQSKALAAYVLQQILALADQGDDAVMGGKLKFK